MKKINQILLICILVLTAVLAAAVAFRAYDAYDTERRLVREREEAEAVRVYERNQEAQARVSEMQMEIQELARDKEALRQFIGSLETEEPAQDAQPEAGADERDGLTSAEDAETEETTDATVDGNAALEADAESEEAAQVMTSGSTGLSGDDAVSGDGISGNDAMSGNSVSGNDSMSGNSVSGNDSMSGNSVSGNDSMSGNSVSDNDSMSGNSVSDNDSMSDNSVSGNDAMSGNSVSGDSVSVNTPESRMTLAERRKLRTSLEETLLASEADRACIAGSRIDFSGKKIACLGDSITAAANLEDEENYQQYAYPAVLQELLGAGEVCNLGVGGSSIGRYWADAYVDRYEEIPEDTDIIIVMGGTNDGFCVSDQEFGSLDNRAYRTFCGDLDELMRGLREHYPDADIFFATPLPNILHDYLMKERDYLLPQQRFADAILALAEEYDYQVIDLYNSNILDSHDADVVEEYMPDGVHGSHEGYRILAQHFAAELIRYYEGEAESMSGNGVSGSGAETISGSDGAVSANEGGTVSADMSPLT